MLSNAFSNLLLFLPLQFSTGASIACVVICSKAKLLFLFLINLLSENVIGCP